MPRSRIIFFLIIGMAIIVVGIATVLQNLYTSNQAAQATAALVTQTAQAAQAAQATIAAVGLPGSGDTTVIPIFAGGKPPSDNLPTYTCAADAFGSYYALQQMQVAGYDVKYGFHLGLVPFYLPSGDYDFSEETRTALLESGKIDCLFTTLDSAALEGSGIITAIIDESAGADQVWARPDIQTLNDLRGKKIIYTQGSISQFFVLYILNVVGLSPTKDVTMVSDDNIQSVVKRFNMGQADAISGWEPDVLGAAQSGAKLLIGSDKLRVAIDVIMTSRQAIQNKMNVVQAFHNAWFYTLKAQFENFPTAAKQIADWGNNDWSAIAPATAQADLGKALDHIAQAGLAQNTAVMKDTTALIERLNTAQRVWEAAGQKAYTGQSADLVDPRFVLEAAKRSDLSTSATPRNNTFLLNSQPSFKAIAPNEGETLGVLPCRKFDFMPNSVDLNSDARRIIDTCVLPVLHSSTGIYLRIVGSAAWLPGDTEQINRQYAMARAKAVGDYLVQNGIDANRFTLDVELPPPEDRNTDDPALQAKYRFVEMTLVTVGR
jgi:ABC-type nitrate/sulfonate/bicarbonate transport system substrate-binding protein